MKYFVTGAQGFSGRFVCDEILRTEPEATIVGTGRSVELPKTFTHDITWQRQRLAAPLTAQLQVIDHDRYRYVRCDLSDEAEIASVVSEAAPDCVIHLAAALRDDSAGLLIGSNVSGSTILVGALSKLARKPRLIFGSSGSVYGPPESVPLGEHQRCAPFEPYAMSKLAAELVVRVLTEHAGIPTLIARIFNIAGPGQEERHVCGRFAAQVAAIVRGDAPPFLEIGDLRPTRDFIDVRDVAQALVKLAHHGKPKEIYNVASGLEISIGEVLTHTLNAAQLDEKVTLVERYSRAADVSRAYADIGKLRDCGFEPRFTIDRTIADLLGYYLVDVANAATTGTTPSAIN